MTLVVGDTNLLASGLVRRKPDTALVLFLDAWRQGRFTLVISGHILTEPTQNAHPPVLPSLSGSFSGR